MKKRSNRKALYGVLGFAVAFIFMVISGNHLLAGFAVAVVVGVICFFIDNMLQNKAKNKVKQSYDMDIPELLVNVAMLMEAGVNVWEAIGVCASLGDKSRPLYIALERAVRAVSSGKCRDYNEALEQMAVECGTSSVSSFVSMVIQNSQKGNNRMAEVFMNSASFYRSERKNTATKLAGQATTLMLLPSAAILIAMILLMVAPAAIQMIGGL